MMKQPKVSLKMLPLLGGLLLLAATPSFAVTIAYIDPAKTTTAPPGKFVTNTAGAVTTGNLLDYDTGADFGDITVSGTYSSSSSTDIEWGVNSPGQPAFDQFEGFIDNSNGAGFQSGLVTFTFSGLANTNMTYILSVTGIRNTNITSSQASRFTLGGADSFANTSSNTPTYSTVIAPDGSYTELSSGTVDIAQWSNIVVGSDGLITLGWDTATGSSGNHYISAISLQAVSAVPEPSSIGLLCVAALGCVAMRRRARQR